MFKKTSHTIQSSTFKSYCLNLFALLILTVCIVLTSQTVSAQSTESISPFDISVTPPTAYLKIHPGNSAVHTITIKNNGTSALEVTPKLVDFSSDGSSGTPVLSTTSTFPYLDIQRTSFETITLPPDAKAQLTLHFSVPSSSENREYPLTILFKTTPAQSSDVVGDSLTPISGTVGSNLIILISDSGELDTRFSVSSFGISPVIDSFAPLELQPVLKNNSFAAAAASGSAVLTNWRGQAVARYEVAPAVVLGYASRQIEPVSDEDTTENQNGLRSFVYDQPFLLGPYTFAISIPSGNPNQPSVIEYKVIIWAIPFAVLIAIAITCFALGGYYFYKKRNSIEW